MSSSLASLEIRGKPQTQAPRTASAGSLVVIRGAPERTLYVGGVPLWLAKSPDALRALLAAAAAPSEPEDPEGEALSPVEFITQLPIDSPAVRHFHITFRTAPSAKRAAERLYRSQIDGHTFAVFCLLRVPPPASPVDAAVTTTASLPSMASTPPSPPLSSVTPSSSLDRMAPLASLSSPSSPTSPSSSSPSLDALPSLPATSTPAALQASDPDLLNDRFIETVAQKDAAEPPAAEPAQAPADAPASSAESADSAPNDAAADEERADSDATTGEPADASALPPDSQSGTCIIS